MINKRGSIETTLTSDLCIGCGICKTVCAAGAISMRWCEERYFKPQVDTDKCTECGHCSNFCPHTFEKIISESKKVAQAGDYLNFGIEGADYYVSYIKNREERFRSASGGITTYVAQWLLRNDKIDAVIHGTMLYGKTGEPHYAAKISDTAEELDQNRRSFYCALSFAEALEELKDRKYKKVLVVGTPCIVRGIKHLIDNDKAFQFVEQICSIALACSHNVNGMFTDYLSDSEQISREKYYKIDLRDKTDSCDANSFRNRWISKGNQTISIVNRLESEFTSQWRNYSFSMNVCNACSDFWGYEADISVKDAWGKWAKDPLGQSIVIVRNPQFNEIFLDNEELYVEKEHFNVIRTCQEETVHFKQYYAGKRAGMKTAAQLNQVSWMHKVNHHMRKVSMERYHKMEKNGYNDSLKKYSMCITMLKRICNKALKVFGKR